MLVASLLCTMLPLPIDLAAISLGVILEFNHSIWWYLLNIFLLALFDTGFGLLTYNITNKLSSKLIRREKTKQKIEDLINKLKTSKWPDLIIFLAAATPFPYTLTIYAASIVDYSKKRFIIINFIGRFIKYTIISLMLYYGLKLI